MSSPPDLTDDEVAALGDRDPEKAGEDFIEANIQKKTSKKKPWVNHCVLVCWSSIQIDLPFFASQIQGCVGLPIVWQEIQGADLRKKTHS